MTSDLNATFRHRPFIKDRREASLRLSLPHRGRGTAIAGDRVLSFILDLRRSPSLFFIPLEPYPARSARHLPHAGKALSVVILFPYMRVFVLTMREYYPLKKAAKPPPLCLPHWGRGTAPAVDRVLS